MRFRLRIGWRSFKAWVQGVGPIGYVLYVLVYVVCCVLLVPALALTLGAGAIFGFAGGAIVNLIGATLGARRRSSWRGPCCVIAWNG